MAFDIEGKGKGWQVHSYAGSNRAAERTFSEFFRQKNRAVIALWLAQRMGASTVTDAKDYSIFVVR